MAARRRIRVAYCLDSFAVGGTELNAVRTAEGLDPDRFELRVYHLQTRGPLRERYERLGVHMEHIPIRNLYSPQTAAQGMRLARCLRREQVDIVHSHDIYCNIFAVPWARLLTPCSVIASRRWGLRASRPKLSLANRWSSRLAHRVLANSSSVAELIARDEGMPRGRIVEVPNFLADEAFADEPPAAVAAQLRAWGVPPGAFTLGIVARLSPVKNHALLLEALARLPARVHAVLVGDGPLRPDLSEQATRLGVGDRVHFAGEVVSGRNLHACFDLSVLCSHSEGFPNSVIEAMAAGKAVVATRVGGVPDAVTHGATGILVAADAGQLADAIATLEADAPLRARLGAAGRRDALSRYRKEAVLATLAQIYESLAARRPGAQA